MENFKDLRRMTNVVITVAIGQAITETRKIFGVDIKKNTRKNFILPREFLTLQKTKYANQQGRNFNARNILSDILFCVIGYNLLPDDFPNNFLNREEFFVTRWRYEKFLLLFFLACMSRRFF